MMLVQDPFTQSQEEKGPQKNRGVLGAQCSVVHVKIRTLLSSSRNVARYHTIMIRDV